MTICIAAIGRERLPDGGTSDVVIMASDRMITLGGRTEYLWADQTKSFWFTKSIVALTADDPDITLEIYRNVLAETLGHTDITVRFVAERVAEEFRKYRRARNERRILSPHGLDFATYIDKNNKIAPALLTKITNELVMGDGVLNATVMIAGLDGVHGSIYLIEDPAIIPLRTLRGYTHYI